MCVFVDDDDNDNVGPETEGKAAKGKAAKCGVMVVVCVGVCVRVHACMRETEGKAVGKAATRVMFVCVGGGMLSQGGQGASASCKCFCV